MSGASHLLVALKNVGSVHDLLGQVEDCWAENQANIPMLEEQLAQITQAQLALGTASTDIQEYHRLERAKELRQRRLDQWRDRSAVDSLKNDITTLYEYLSTSERYRYAQHAGAVLTAATSAAQNDDDIGLLPLEAMAPGEDGVDGTETGDGNAIVVSDGEDEEEDTDDDAHRRSLFFTGAISSLDGMMDIKPSQSDHLDAMETLQANVTHSSAEHDGVVAIEEQDREAFAAAVDVTLLPRKSKRSYEEAIGQIRTAEELREVGLDEFTVAKLQAPSSCGQEAAPQCRLTSGKKSRKQHMTPEELREALTRDPHADSKAIGIYHEQHAAMMEIIKKRNLLEDVLATPCYNLRQFCPNKGCGKPYINVQEESKLVCQHCFTSINIIDSTPTAVAFASDTENQQYSYERFTHLMNKLEPFLPHREMKIENEAETLDAVKYLLRQNRFFTKAELTFDKVALLLKSLGYTSLYKAKYAITMKFNNRYWPVVNEYQELKLVLAFLVLQESFERIKKSTRSSFLKYEFAMYHGSNMLGFTHLLPYFRLLETKERHQKQLALFRSMVKQENWPYNPVM